MTSSKRSVCRRSATASKALSKTAASIVYRLRSRGFRIDTKARTIFIPTGLEVPNLSPLTRLRKEFGFQVQTCFKEDDYRARVYISGPIAHYNLNERRKVFAAAKHRLRKSGYLPVNPMDNGLPQPGDWREHMRTGIANLLRCQYIYLLPDWQYSKGCRLELDVAMSCGLHILNL